MDRAHLGEWLVQPEDLLHQDGVLVGRDAILDDRPLADRLQEAGGQAATLEAVEDTEADRGLAPVLPGRGEIDMPHPVIFDRSERRGDAPRAIVARIRDASTGSLPAIGTRAPRPVAELRDAIGPRIQLRLAVLRSMSWIASRRRASVSASTASGSRYGPEPLHDVGHEAQEDAGVGDEELRLVVVADERQAALQDAPVLDMGDLRREVVALDAVGVVEEVERVVDGQPEPRPPGDQSLVDLGRDAHLGDLVEDLRRDGQQPDQRRPGARTEHHLEAPLEGEHLGIEARAGDDVGQQVLDVVEDARLGDRVREVEDLLLEQELLFVIEHGADGSTGHPWPRCAYLAAPGYRTPRSMTGAFDLFVPVGGLTGRCRAWPSRRRRARRPAGRPRSACRRTRGWRWRGSR